MENSRIFRLKNAKAPTHTRPLPFIDKNPFKTHAGSINYYISPAVKDVLNTLMGNLEPGPLPFEVKEKTGFKTTADKVIILDENKRVFYIKKRTGHELNFNLPPGKYFLQYGKIDKRPRPVNYKIPVLPAPYSYIKPPPKKFKILYGNNPNKCTVDIRRDTIVFDNTFKNYPRFILDYIIRHEKGHYFYRGRGQSSELHCDKYAAAGMLKAGYNPSQISAAVRFTLSNSPKSRERKKENWENIKNVFI